MAYKILIVDDEKMLTELLEAHLQDCGYTTFIANSGEDAIALLKVQPDLIVLDINMPGRDGFDFCRSIRLFCERKLG